jgi:hypothetical protein
LYSGRVNSAIFFSIKSWKCGWYLLLRKKFDYHKQQQQLSNNYQPIDRAIDTNCCVGSFHFVENSGHRCWH